MKRCSFNVFRVLLACVIALSAVTTVSAQFDQKLFSGMKARSIGPAGMSGRIGAIEAVVADPNTIYVGAATGGVWKSTSGGITWKPIFDDQPVSSIGAIAVFQPNPDIVWVGTGEGATRNSSGVGNGVYKSLDGGHTWTHVGLDKTERIHRIVLHPRDPNIAYVAALGTTWGENPERGVFKTTDGGKTWKKVLYVDEKTGCADLVMDPRNPEKLFAAMWQHRRWPWFFKSGGPGSGLYVTYSGGRHWKRLTEKDGLPKGELGRIGLAIARSHHNTVYALVEAKKSALCRSDDGGLHWKIINTSPNVNPRPFYFADIHVDPQNENRIYKLHTVLTVSDDGGKSFRTLLPFSRVHPDHHALWIHPTDGRLLIDGNDGGVAISHDRGQAWRFIDNLPLAQFYHINVDMQVPFNIYGGMQDNGSWRGPSELWENGDIRNYHWVEVGFGDGFDTLSDPSEPAVGYSMSQGGYLRRFNLRTGERKDIRPPAPDGVKLRFNWNAGIALDPFDPKTIYFGSQYVHRSTDRGESWTIISPDLTTNEPGKQKQDVSGGLTRDVTAAENFTTILTIAPSPVQRGVIWVGTDDGYVQLTRDGGKTWRNVTKRIPDLPRDIWCPHIEASKFEPGSAFVVFDDHRRNNWATYIYRTDDFGESWVSLSTHPPTDGSAATPWGFAHVIEQDPVDKDLLYLGTEFGLYVSLDGGQHWMKWTQGVPTVPVRALIVHPRDNDLVIGTHGRAAYILDDVRPLRKITQELLDKPLHLFEVPSVYQHQIKQVDGYRFPADGMFRGQNRPYGALITYIVNPSEVEGQKAKEEVEETEADAESTKEKIKLVVEILDARGEVIRKMKGPMKRGLNRVTWNLRRDPFELPPIPGGGDRGAPQGPEVLPGTYTVRITLGGQSASQTVEVQPDPRTHLSMRERRQKYEALMRVGQRLEVVTEAVKHIRRTKKMIDAALEQVKERKQDTGWNMKKAARKLKKSLTQVSDKLIGPTGQGIYPRDQTAIGKLGYVARSLGTSWDAPTAAQRSYLRQAETFLASALKEFNRVYAEDVAEFARKAKAANVGLFPKESPLNLDWKRKKEE